MINYKMDKLLLKMLKPGKNFSDLNQSIDNPPQIEVDSELQPVQVPGLPVLTPYHTEAVAMSLMDGKKEHLAELYRRGSVDLSYAIPGVTRFRVNIFKQRGTLAAVLRVIPQGIPSLDELGLPEELYNIRKVKNGIVLVTGPTGSGKSTTLAAMLDKVNRERHEHIVTIEDPVEYLHSHQACIVNQRELSADTHSFANALRSVLRQDPDVVLIGEMRDLETVEAALRIAETGHLTLATLHTNSAAQTMNRIIDVFPAHQQPQIRVQLSFVLEGIMCQSLLPRASGKGRALAAEVLLPTPAIRNLIREDKIHQVYGMMQTGQSKHGMMTFNQSLANLYFKRAITMQTALSRSSSPDELQEIISRGAEAMNPAVQGRPATARTARR